MHMDSLKLENGKKIHKMSTYQYGLKAKRNQQAPDRRAEIRSCVTAFWHFGTDSMQRIFSDTLHHPIYKPEKTWMKDLEDVNGLSSPPVFDDTSLAEYCSAMRRVKPVPNPPATMTTLLRPALNPSAPTVPPLPHLFQPQTRLQIPQPNFSAQL
ncbi:hypothetical protein BDP27DRAFT_1408158 [Rhodocollybia butyracea]|uniref:Uncharacterized protein n=1 Tax=Rhodocollybia butyracea TaxID=206335 RepID=A0A9P5TWP9_9AGAR|nr:hypothetical protein BDP27DRAFT_1408158 [Rhodocollybia butyracea]